MTRLAVPADLDEIEAGYDEHFAYEAAHGAYTVWEKGVYPTRQSAETAIAAGTIQREASILSLRHLWL